jgi:hypothetical protein
MADNVTLPGSGAVVATDEVTDGTLGTVQVQYMKLMDGTLNSTNKAFVNSAGELAIVASGEAASGAAVSGNPVLIGGSDGTNARTLKTDTTGVLAVENLDTIASGTITALNGAVTTVEVDGNSTTTIQITGTWVATLVFEGSLDNTNWFSLNAAPFPSGTYVTSTTANGFWQTNTAGVDYVRVRASAFTSGTASVLIDVSAGVGVVSIDDPIPAGTNIIGKVGIDQTTVGTTNAVSLSQIGATTILTGGVAGSQGIGGLAATGATASGNPVPVSGTFNTTQPTVTTGQNVQFQATARGAQIVATGADTFNATINAALPAGTNLMGKVGIDQTTVGTTNAVSLAQIGATTIVTGGVNGTQAVGGITAVNATSTGNPVYSGGIALVAANPTAATNGQRTGFATDKVGRQLVVVGHERTMTGIQQTTIPSSTAETTIVTAGAAGVFNDITHLSVTNGSATATIVTLKDATAGTTRGIWNVAAGGGFVVSFPTPLAQATAANNWTLTCGTSVASIYVVCQYVKNS